MTETTKNRTKSIIKRFKNSVPCLFVWFLLVTCDVIYYAIVWPSLVSVIGLYNQGYLSFGILLAIKIYLLLSITMNLCLSTFSDPGFLPQQQGSSELSNSVVARDKGFIVINVFNQKVQLKWCSVGLLKLDYGFNIN